jgi:hypothetical protein
VQFFRQNTDSIVHIISTSQKPATKTCHFLICLSFVSLTPKSLLLQFSHQFRRFLHTSSHFLGLLSLPAKTRMNNKNIRVCSWVALAIMGVEAGQNARPIRIMRYVCSLGGMSDIDIRSNTTRIACFCPDLAAARSKLLYLGQS